MVRTGRAPLLPGKDETLMRPSNHPRNIWFVTAVVAAVALFSPGVFAKPVAKEDAATAVSGWLKQPGRGLKAPIGNAVKETEAFTDAAGNPQYYVVYLKPSGFVIVPADDLVEPVICFSPAGKYVASDKNPLGALVMRDIPGRLAAARAKQPAGAPPAQLKDAQRKWEKFRAATAPAAGPETSPPSSVSDVRVAPLTQTTWSQEGPDEDDSTACYNYYTPPGPNGSSSNYVSGCVATAMAQLIYYTHTISPGWLSSGVGTVSSYYYVDDVQQPNVNLRGGNGSGGAYDWADMVLSPGGSITATQCQAIGALCYDAGVAVNMDYNTGNSGESGADTLQAATAFKNFFMYSNAVKGNNNNNNIGAGLNGMVNPNLDAGWPVQFGINDGASGHSVVGDGYGYDSATLYHHLNLGWSGVATAWYNLPNIDAGGYNFNSVYKCVYNIFTSGTGEIISGRVLDPSGNPISGAAVQAVRTGGGSWSTTTNANGIYVFAKIPSASTYTLSATAPGQTYSDLTAVTGTSTDSSSTSGNVWGKDFGGPPPLIITTTSLPDGMLGAVYSATLAATGGTPPYSWWMVPAESLTAHVTPSGGSARGWRADDYSWSYTLPFTFPYMGQNYTSVYVCSNGFLDFASSATDYSNSDAGLESNARIAPLWYDLVTNGSTQSGEDIYIHQPDANSVAIRWVAETWYYGYPVNFEVVLHSTGQIEFHYGAGNTGLSPTVGLGSGNLSYYVLSAHDNQSTLTNAQTSLFKPPLHDGLTLNASTGAIGGTPTVSGTRNVRFVVCDSRGTQADTTLALTVNAYTLTVQSTPRTGLTIGSSNAGQNGTTNYTVPNITYNTSVNLQAPATDPPGYTFLQWTVNATPQTAGLKNITFSMTANTTAVAQYTTNTYTLTVQSTPPTGLTIGSSNAGQNGTTNYTVTGVAYNTSVNLQAPVTDPAGYTFAYWTINGAAQTPGQKSVTFMMDAAVTAVARYTSNIGYTLSVQSTSPTGLSIGSGTGHGGTTNYTKTGVGNGASVNLVAPDTDPSGYTFLQWTVNNAAQTPGQKSITFAMDAAVTAVAHYTSNTGYTLSVQSTPPTGDFIGSSTFHGGITNYTVPGVAYGTSVNLQAPVTDPSGYTFSRWTVNGAAQTPGQKSITFAMDAAVTAVARYTSNTGYTLSVQSTPPTGVSIGSSTAHGGKTNYTKTGVAYGTSVNLQAPDTDPAGYTFSQWTVNGAAQPPGQKSVTFAMDGAVTAVARYTSNIGYTLSVHSTPLTALSVGSSTTHGGTTNYTKTGVGNGTSVNLQAPATDPTGYTFSQWTVNGAAQPAGQKSITFTMDGAMTAVAQYTLNGYALTVESTPPTGLSIGSSTGHKGTTNYYVNSGVAQGTSVNLQAPATDPSGYTFSQWSVNGAPESPGQKSVTFTMDGSMTAVAQYTLNGYALTVQSTPPAAVGIGSSTGHTGTTNYTKRGSRMEQA